MKKLITLALAFSMMLGGSLAYSSTLTKNAAKAKAAPAASISVSTAKKAK